MLWQPSHRYLPHAPRCVRPSRVRLIPTACLLLVSISVFSGCATFGRRGPAAEKAAACRELTQQGISAMEMGQWQRAELLLQQAVETCPHDADAHRYLAETLWQRGETEKAKLQLAAAMEASPRDATLAMRSGEVALAMGAADEALRYAELAVRLDPRLAAAWALRGRVFWQLKQNERALADMLRALEIAPSSSEYLLDVAVMYRDRGEPARCLTTLQHLHERQSGGDEPQAALVLEGLTLLDLGRPHQACEPLLAATQLGTPTAQVVYYLAHAQYAAGRYAEATATAQKAIAMDSTHEASQKLLAQLATQTAPAELQRR